MVRLWPLWVLVLIVLGSGFRLLLLERDTARLERERARGLTEDGRAEVALLTSLSRILPRGLTRVAHFSGAALGLVALSRALATQESPLVGLGCLVCGSTVAVVISARGRRIEERIRALNRSSRAEMRGQEGKV